MIFLHSFHKKFTEQAKKKAQESLQNVIKFLKPIGDDGMAFLVYGFAFNPKKKR